MKKIVKLFKKLAPWAIAVGIFAYLFHLYPATQVWHALGRVDAPAFVSFAIAYFAFIYLVDTWTMQKVITKFSHAVTFRDIFAARGVTYLVMILNYPASQAAFAYYLKRKYGIAIFEALGMFFFIVFVDLLWIISLAFAGSFFQDYSIAGVDMGRTVQVTAFVAYAATLLWMAFWRRWPERVTGRRLQIPIVEKLRAKKAFNIFNRARVGDYLNVALMRTPIHLTIIISMYVVVGTFNASVPFVKILGNMPLVFILGTLPITPGGLGTTNAAMVELLSPYLTGPVFADGGITPQELLFTASLLWVFVNYLLKVVVGLITLKKVSGELFKPTADVPEEDAERQVIDVQDNL